MKAGDELVAVDGVGISGLTVDEVVSRVPGPEGSEVVLELKSPGGTTRTLTITRAKLDLPLVSWAFAPGTKNAVIRLESFSSGAAKAVTAALKDAMGKGAEGVVLDLRGNPGGYVNEPVETASLFLEKGVVYRSVDRSGKETAHDVLGNPAAPGPAAGPPRRRSDGQQRGDPHRLPPGCGPGARGRHKDVRRGDGREHVPAQGWRGSHDRHRALADPKGACHLARGPGARRGRGAAPGLDPRGAGRLRQSSGRAASRGATTRS